MSEEPESPCVSICVLDDQDICQGCYRSAEEITDWFMSSVGEKREILDLAQERRNASSTIWLK
jgi:predicted Fe-S protein YdhL (DUF1289 family)